LGVIGGYWLIRRRRPWVLGGGFVLWIVIYSALLGLGTTEAFQNWALNWMVPA
ncbi:MAG: hypothetical protein GTO67_12940, partial [Gammaproteobacteria bacterium]|nr:hypothetical protein [Gammaproteobacteria bacterium]NIT17208.1 hypothetical protein [Gammaproteobacteria bacterium]